MDGSSTPEPHGPELGRARPGIRGHFFVGRDEAGTLAVAFDASENDFKRKRGFRAEGAWVVNNKCDTATRLAEVNLGRSGCGPVPLRFHQEGATLVLAENDILEGWRYFR